MVSTSATDTHSLSSTTTGMKNSPRFLFNFRDGQKHNRSRMKWMSCTYMYMLRNSHCQVISSSLLALILCLGRLLEPDRLSKREIWSIERCQQFVVVLVAATTRIGREIGSKVRESGDLFFSVRSWAVWPRNK